MLIKEATFLFAKSINSSINLCASFDVLKKTDSGLSSSSRLKLTSTRSKEIAPFFIRLERKIFACLSKILIASKTGLGIL